MTEDSRETEYKPTAAQLVDEWHDRGLEVDEVRRVSDKLAADHTISSAVREEIHAIADKWQADSEGRRQ